MELFNRTHINWVGANAADTETKFFNNINNCSLKKLVRGQKEKKSGFWWCDLHPETACKGPVQCSQIE